MPAAADAAITLGRSPLPERTSVTSDVGSPTLFFNVTQPPLLSLTSPIDGVVVRWRVRGGNGPGLNTADNYTLRIIRPDLLEYMPVASSAPLAVAGNEVPSAVFEQGSRVRIAAGDYIGVSKTLTPIPTHMNSGSIYTTSPALADGTSGPFVSSTFPNREIILNADADVEADVDGDGYGDETQDGCPSQSATHGACFVAPPPPPPDVTKPTITKAKLNKKKTTGSLKFTFRLSEPAKVKFTIRRRTSGWTPLDGPFGGSGRFWTVCVDGRLTFLGPRGLDVCRSRVNGACPPLPSPTSRCASRAAQPSCSRRSRRSC